MRTTFRWSAALAVLIACAALVIGLWLVGSRQEAEEWSCEPEAARREFDAGLAANMKYYGGEALEHFERALALSPDCAVAQLEVARRLPWGSKQQKELLAKLERTDVSALPDREAFLVRYYLAAFHDEHDEQEAILDAYLERHPKDPYALEHRCENLWIEARSDEAEACYERLLRVDPNWVVAQNRLGYLAMARGEMDRSEDRFRTYRYVAPDQANPHDSLGELLVLRGRYEEADAELEAALAVRADFCASYEHLVFSYLDQGDVAGARDAVARGLATGACEGIEGLDCEIDGFALYLAKDWSTLAARWDEPCHGRSHRAPWLPHLGALMSGDFERARAIEASLASRGKGESSDRKKSVYDVDLALLRGVRELAEGQAAQAEELLRQADEKTAYQNLGVGRTKLYTRLALAEALERQGKRREADGVLAQVAAVNPHYADAYRAGTIPFPGG